MSGHDRQIGNVVADKGTYDSIPTMDGAKSTITGGCSKVKMLASVVAVVSLVFIIILAQSAAGEPDSPEYSLSLSGSFSSYPGYTGSLAVSGTVKMTFFEGTVDINYIDLIADPACADGPTGLDNSCGIHFHEGTTCEDADEVGGHFFSGDADPWVIDAVYTGNGEGELSVDYGYDYPDTEGRALILHDALGSRISCELLYPQMVLTMSIEGAYPGYDGSLSTTGEVELNFQATQVTIHYSLSGADPACDNGPTEGVSNSCGIHIHEGTSCDTNDDVSGHYYDSSIMSDPWEFNASYTGSEGRLVVEYGYGWESTEGRVFVVHDVSGTRVTCDVISA